MHKRLSLLLLIGLTACQQPPSAPHSEVTPIVFVEPAPLPDFTVYSSTKEKKAAFFAYLLPLIEQANVAILAEREQALNLLAQVSLNEEEALVLEDILIKYRIKNTDPLERKQMIERRVIPLPPSLVLAQAANESAWGSSRFATEGNNLFGQWCFRAGCGMIPGERNHRARHEVRVFASPYESVASYMLNLNTHPQYQDLRDLRQVEIDLIGHSTGLNLASGLVGYSERGVEYVLEVQRMIHNNNLARLDTVKAIDIKEG